MKKHAPKKSNSVGFSYDQSIPSQTVLCSVCSKGWNIKNVHDVVQRSSHDFVELAEVIGKTLGEVKEFYYSKVDARYFIGTEPFMFNEGFKDNSLRYPNPKDDWEKTQVKNDNGWVGTNDGINDEYVIKKGDWVNFQIIHYLHSGCNRKDLETRYTDFFREIFTKAGFLRIEMKSIKNEYCGCDHCAPWFEIATEFGMIKIGWRKQVMDIDWTEARSEKQDFLHLFALEDVTKGENGIHAWTKEKAIEYLSKMVDYLKK